MGTFAAAEAKSQESSSHEKTLEVVSKDREDGASGEETQAKTRKKVRVKNASTTTRESPPSMAAAGYIAATGRSRRREQATIVGIEEKLAKRDDWGLVLG